MLSFLRKNNNNNDENSSEIINWNRYVNQELKKEYVSVGEKWYSDHIEERAKCVLHFVQV